MSVAPGPVHREQIIACGLEQLRRAGLKLTPQREVILELLADHRGHVTPQQIVSRLDAAASSLSQATVYNTLEVFESVGIVGRLTGADGQTYFDINTDAHHHAICDGCGELFDVRLPAGSVDGLLSKAQAYHPVDAGFRVEVASVWFRGECAACRSGR